MSAAAWRQLRAYFDEALTLPPALEGHDVAGQAQTGTGKTAAFLLVIFNRLLQDRSEDHGNNPRSLVVAPTRELVIQIAKDAVALGKYTDIRCEAVYGGMDYEKQRRQLQAGPVDIIAATPGRLLDYTSKRVLDLHSVEMLVIDEGFGTQDSEGREGVIGAINAVKDDFACILVITHIEELQQRIEDADLLLDLARAVPLDPALRLSALWRLGSGICTRTRATKSSASTRSSSPGSDASCPPLRV